MQEVLPKPIQQALVNRQNLTDSLFKRSESLSNLLPYSEYSNEFGVFLNKDGSLGVIFEVELLEHEPVTGPNIVKCVESLGTLFNLPENCVLQIHYDQSYISKNDPVWKGTVNKYPYAHPVSQALFDERIKTIREKCNTLDVKAPLSRKTYLSIRYFPKIKTSAAKLTFKKGESVLFNEMDKFVQEVKTFCNIIAQYKSNSRLKLNQLDGQDLVTLLRRFFNPKEFYKRDFAKFNEHHSISDQVIYTSPTLDHKGIEREKVKARVLTLKTSPQIAYPGGMAYFTRINFPFKLSLNFSFPSKQKIKQFFDLKEFFLQNTPTAKARIQRKEILEAQDRMAYGERCLYLTFNVVLEGENDEELDQRTRELVNIFHTELECEVIIEDEIGLGMALNTLPLNYTPDADASAQRYIRILQKDVLMFLPVFDSFRGMKNPLQVYLSRENNLINFNLLENETSNHTVVLADSGSGKSAFIIDCVQAAKRIDPEPLIFVIDKKSSYKTLAKYFDGDLTVFDASGDMPFSPFRGVFDDSKINFLTNLLATAIRLMSPKFDVESEHISAISKALRLAYEKKKKELGLVYEGGDLKSKDSDDDVEVTMDDVVAALSALTADSDFEALKDQIEHVLVKLRPYYGDGIYAKYFKGSSNQNKSQKTKLFYIYDLDALDSDPVLQTLMTMSVIEEIRSTIKLPEHQGRGGFIVLEELGMLGRDNPTAQKFIIDAAETFRKLGFWLIGLTPRPQNYFEMDAGKAMWGVADNFIFLKMSSDNVDYLSTNSKLIDEANGEIIKSLQTIKGQHAEVFYVNKNKSKQGAFRYFQTPLDRWLAPTNDKDFHLVQKTFDKFKGNAWKSLEYLAENYPDGIQTDGEFNDKNN